MMKWLFHFRVSDVRKEIKIIKFWNSDITIGFPIPKIFTRAHLQIKTIIILSFLAFQVVLIPFWVILGVRDVTKEGKILKF